MAIIDLCNSGPAVIKRKGARAAGRVPAHHFLYALMLAVPVLGIVAFVWDGLAFDYGLFQLDFGVAKNPASSIRPRKFISAHDAKRPRIATQRASARQDRPRVSAIGA